MITFLGDQNFFLTWSKTMPDSPSRKREERGKRSQETVQGFLQQLRANFRCQKLKFQNVPQLRTFYKSTISKHWVHREYSYPLEKQGDLCNFLEIQLCQMV